MSLLDKLQRFAFDDLARTEAGSAILLVSESEYAELRAAAAHTCTVTLTGPQIRDLAEACGGDFTELTRYTVGERGAFVTDDGEQMPAGLYATCTDYPEEGFIGPLGAESEADRPESPPPPPEPPAKRLIHERAPWPFTGTACTCDGEYKLDADCPAHGDPSFANVGREEVDRG